MLEERLSFTLSLVVDFVNADFLIPRGDGEMIAGGGKAEVGDAILRRLVQSHILGDVAGGVGRSCRRRGRGGAEK